MAMTTPRSGTRLHHALTALAAIPLSADARTVEKGVLRHLTEHGCQVIVQGSDVSTMPPGRGDGWLISVEPEPADSSYTVALVHLLAGLPTEAALYSSLDGTPVWASLGGGTFGSEGRIRLDTDHADPGPITISLRDSSASDGAADRVQADGCRVLLYREDALSLLAMLGGRSAGFIGDSTNSCTRMAAALLIAEARGRVSDWSGMFPTPGESSLLAARDLRHHILLIEATSPARTRIRDGL
jgi:hypothetical protein